MSLTAVGDRHCTTCHSALKVNSGQLTVNTSPSGHLFYMGDPVIGGAINNLADKLFYLGDWRRAEELLKSAIEIARETRGVTTLGGALDTLAQLCLLRGEVAEADRLLEESLKVFSPIKSGEWAEVSTLITIG